jgi:hypothetical protein
MYISSRHIDAFLRRDKLSMIMREALMTHDIPPVIDANSLEGCPS